MSGKLYTQTSEKVTIFAQNGSTVATIASEDDDRVVKVTMEDLTVSEPATLESIVKKIEKYGGCIVKNYLPKEDCATILNDVRPFLDQDFSWQGDLSPVETKKCSRSAVKSKTVAEKFVAHPLNIEVSNHFLSKKNYFISGGKVASGVSRAQHNSTITFDVGPGAPNQIFHRDDMLHHNIREKMATFEYGRETGVGSLMALTKTTRANGATRFVPGSHLWDHFRMPKEEECVYAELDVGDCFFMLASCFHGGSANTTKDQHRIVIICFMTSGTHRQEENIFLGTPIEYFRSLSVEALKALGLTVSEPFCGFYELRDPLKFLKEDLDVGGGDDMYTEQYEIVNI